MKKTSTRRGPVAERVQVAQAPPQAAPPILVGGSSLSCHPSSSPDAHLDLKMPIYIPPLDDHDQGSGETRNKETKAVPAKIGGEMLPESPLDASPPSPTSTPSSPL
jgi:hypothetical protein